MKFVYPWMLIFVALVPVAGLVWLLLRNHAGKRMAALVAPSLRGRLVPQNPRLFNVQAALLLAGLFLVVFAAARPQWGRSAETFRGKSRNVVVALDVSRSMLAQDVRPNRLERAKADIADLIDSLEGDRCALVAFRRTGELICPLTTDRAFLRDALEKATPESAPRGETDLGAAIRTCLAALDPAADDHNAIILVSDGGDLRGGVLEAARLAAKRKVPVFTVGLGNPKVPSPIPAADGNGYQQYQGQNVMTRLEEGALSAVAKTSGGRYVSLATAGTAETTLGAIYRRFLTRVAAQEQAEEEELRATERFGLFLAPGLFLILLAAFFSRGRFAGRTTRLALCLLLPVMMLPAEETPPSSNLVVQVESPDAKGQGPKTNDQRPEPPAYTPPPETQLTDGEIWNKGVDQFRAGDYTNALATLQGITLSRTHGPRAAEVVGAILHAKRQAALAQTKDATGVQADQAALEPLRRACKAAEESAAALQLTLRAQPGDPRVNRNFTRAVTGLETLREELRMAEVLARTKSRDPKELMAGAAHEALALLEAQQGVLTNEASVAVAQSEALARRAETLEETLIPLKHHILQSVTNEQQAATIVGDVEATRAAVKRAAEELGDLSSDAATSLATAETAFHRYWLGVLDVPGALAECSRAQTNAVAKLPPENGRDWQQEAAVCAHLFNAKFEDWVKQACAQDTPVASNQPPYTLEIAQHVGTAMREIAKKQAELTQKTNAEDQAQMLAGLARVTARMGLVAGDPRSIVGYDIQMQTNAYAGVDRSDGFDWQRDAHDATRAFRAKFPAWAQQKAQAIQQQIQNGNTNAVPFTPEAQAEIAKLATQAEAMQAKMVKTPLPPEQLAVLGALARIAELLPKDPQNNQQNPQQQPPQQPQQQPQDQDKNQDRNQDQNPDQNPDQDQPPPKEDPKEQPKEPQDQQEVEELLQKAQERSDEHEAEKKARMRQHKPSPNERDW